MSAKFTYARSEVTGRIFSIMEMSRENRNIHGDLICPGCETSMVPVLGFVRDWHFRHGKGEGCAEYFAVLAEELICRGIVEAQAQQESYLLVLPGNKSVDLTVTRNIVRGQTLDDRRVDIALISDRGRINVVIARREADLSIPYGAEGLWLVIDVTHQEEDLVATLRDQIQFEYSWMKKSGFPAPKRVARARPMPENPDVNSYRTATFNTSHQNLRGRTIPEPIKVEPVKLPEYNGIPYYMPSIEEVKMRKRYWESDAEHKERLAREFPDHSVSLE